MATTVSQIDAWRSARSEHQNLEFKEAKTQFDNRKLYKYCVALANEGGGHLLLGIEDQPPRKVVGTAAFNDPVEMAAKMFQPKPAGSLQTAGIQGGLGFPDHRGHGGCGQNQAGGSHTNLNPLPQLCAVLGLISL